MRVSELLTEGVESFLAFAPETESHLKNKENPHGVTKAQLGLGNVINEKQATDADFRSHKSVAVLDHPDGSVTASKLGKSSVTKEKIAAGAVGRDALEEGCITEDRLSMTVRNGIAKKVDKEEGMGLSENSFTNAEKAKLASITVTDGEGLLVDTGALVMKNMPLLLQKQESRFVKTDETVLGTNMFAEFIGADYTMGSGELTVWGRREDGVYVLFVRDHAGKTKIYTGSANTVCHSISQGTVYFGEMQDNVITVLRDTGSGGEPWRTLTASVGGNTELWHMFISYDDIRVVYFRHNSSPASMVTERYNFTGERQWAFTTSSRSKSNYSADSTIYNRRYRMACMDGKDLYIAPVLDTNRKFAVLRIDETGSLSGQYMALTSFTSDTQVLQDIFVQGGVIYGRVGSSIVRIDTIRNAENTIFSGNTSIKKMQGISVGKDGDVYTCMETSGGYSILYRISGDGTGSCTLGNNPYVKAKLEITEIDRLARMTDRGLELFHSEETRMISTIYNTADVFTIL